MVGRADGGVVHQRPHGDMNEGPVPNDRKRSDPHFPQCVLLASGPPKIISASAPFVIASFERSIPANGLKAEPVVLRQFEQWQLAA